MARGRGRNRVRLVRDKPLSPPAQMLATVLPEHLEPEREGWTQVAGFVLITLYNCGTTSKSIYTPCVSEGAPCGRDLFQALAKQAIDNMVVDRIADDRAADRINSAMGYDPEEDPAS